jgi:hypothetical protein
MQQNASDFVTRNLVRRVLIAGAMLGVMFVCAALGAFWSWPLLAVGVALAVALELLSRPGRPLDIGRLVKGHQGETTASLFLRDLERFNVRVFTDPGPIPGLRGNADFVLVGPTGVFCLEVKKTGQAA